MRALSLLAFALILSACRDEEITRVRAPKEDAPTLAAPAAEPAAGRLRWNVPKGWKELPASGMRRATLLPSADGKAEVTVIAFPGEAGGELANVNRWRGQIGLPAIDAAALSSARARVESKAGAVSLYDFSSSGAKKTRIVAGAVPAAGMTWFIKLMGDPDEVAAARPAFLSLLESLHVAR